MPKIIFRPNPTPPPFDPPTPQPTVNLIRVNPYPWIEYEYITAIFSDIQYPAEWDSCYIDIFDSNDDIWLTSMELSSEDFVENHPYTFRPEVLFENFGGFSLQFLKDYVEIERVLLSIVD